VKLLGDIPPFRSILVIYGTVCVALTAELIAVIDIFIREMKQQ